jgi:predicted dehydrogenase
MLKVGVIGYGYWGPNLVRNFVESEQTEVTRVCDLNSKRLGLVKARYPSIQITTDPYALIQSPDVDAVAVATPVFSHFELAMASLRAGKHVFVEKPLAASSTQAAQLIEEADKKHVTLMVDHTFVYTSAVRKIRELVLNGELGQPYYYDSVRINLGLFQHDVNVIWDLAVHDLSILQYILRSAPAAVSATGTNHVSGGTENIAYITLFFPDNFIAHIHVNWLAPVKIRRTMIGGSRRMLIYDDVEGSEKIKVYDQGIQISDSPEKIHQLRINYRAGDMWAPRLDNTEALSAEVWEFVDAIQSRRKPLTDGEAGLQVVRILEAATESMALHGQMIKFSEKFRRDPIRRLKSAVPEHQKRNRPGHFNGSGVRPVRAGNASRGI